MRPVAFCNKMSLLLHRFRNNSGKKGRKKTPRFEADFYHFSADFFESFGDFELDFYEAAVYRKKGFAVKILDAFGVELQLPDESA